MLVWSNLVGTLHLTFRNFKVAGIISGLPYFKIIDMTVAKILERSKFPSIFFFYSLIAKIIRKNDSASKPSVTN